MHPQREAPADDHRAFLRDLPRLSRDQRRAPHRAVQDVLADYQGTLASRSGRPTTRTCAPTWRTLVASGQHPNTVRKKRAMILAFYGWCFDERLISAEVLMRVPARPEPPGRQRRESAEAVHAHGDRAVLGGPRRQLAARPRRASAALAQGHVPLSQGGQPLHARADRGHLPPGAARGPAPGRDLPGRTARHPLRQRLHRRPPRRPQEPAGPAQAARSPDDRRPGARAARLVRVARGDPADRAQGRPSRLAVAVARLQPGEGHVGQADAPRALRGTADDDRRRLQLHRLRHTCGTEWLRNGLPWSRSRPCSATPAFNRRSRTPRSSRKTWRRGWARWPSTSRRPSDAPCSRSGPRRGRRRSRVSAELEAIDAVRMATLESLMGGVESATRSSSNERCALLHLRHPDRPEGAGARMVFGRALKVHVGIYNRWGWEWQQANPDRHLFDELMIVELLARKRAITRSSSASGSRRSAGYTRRAATASAATAPICPTASRCRRRAG
jgi:hypothetical protein